MGHDKQTKLVEMHYCVNPTHQARHVFMGKTCPVCGQKGRRKISGHRDNADLRRDKEVQDESV